MKYSIILCYRNRKKHLQQSLPEIRRWFASRNLNYEIIVVEQNDDFKFRRGALFNAGAQKATGDVLIFHDVDYVPSNVFSYCNEPCDVYLPVKQVIFMAEDNVTKRPIEDVPAGYRRFHETVDDNFFGGVISFTRDAFFKINGFNTYYSGWGLEDEDLRERIASHNLKCIRGGGEFLSLYHPDSNPGLQDAAFKLNQQIFSNRQSYLKFGVNTQKYSVSYTRTDLLDEFPVDLWLAVAGPPSSEYSSIDATTKIYRDEPVLHEDLWKGFKFHVNHTPELKAHRDWVVEWRWGYGNRAFHWLWNLLVAQAPYDFRFLEIGVFKGQTLSLVSMLNMLYRKDGTVYGVTPLDRTGDKYNLHPESEYENDIATIYAINHLDATDMNLIPGLSIDPKVKGIVEQISPFDLIYIDGGHDYETVVNDIETYAPMMKIGGYLVMDDASNDLKIPDGLIRNNWRGLPDVTRAVSGVLDHDKRFVLRFAVGHNKIYQRIS